MLNRHRNERLPHIVVVTAEPLTSRLAFLCRGTGDIDAVYHVALDELLTAVNDVDPPSLGVLNELIASVGFLTSSTSGQHWPARSTSHGELLREEALHTAGAHIPSVVDGR